MQHMQYVSIQIYRNHREVVDFNSLAFDKTVVRKMLVYSIFTIGV